MKPNELAKKLNSFLNDGITNEVFLDTQNHVTKGNYDSQTLAPINAPGMIGDAGISVIDYVHLLENSRFSMIFDDYALVIVECLFKKGNLIKHRYTYIPCPIDKKAMLDRPDEVPIADWILELSTGNNGFESFRSVGIYRFDFAPAQGGENHPVSHFTFASPKCRMPVKAPLSIRDFMSFLFDNFYPQHASFWYSHSPFLNCSGINNHSITEEEMVRLHLNWVGEC